MNTFNCCGGEGQHEDFCDVGAYNRERIAISEMQRLRDRIKELEKERDEARAKNGVWAETAMAEQKRADEAQSLHAKMTVYAEQVEYKLAALQETLDSICEICQEKCKHENRS